MRCVELSIEKLEEKSNLLAEKIQHDFNPDVVVYIARGGYLIGKRVSGYFGIPLIAVGTERQANGFKEMVAPILALMPRALCDWLRSLELRSNVHEKGNKRAVKFLDDVGHLKTKKIKNIVIVDDSVDTGNSVLAVKRLISSDFPLANIKIAAINVWSKSENLIATDFYIYQNAMMRTPMSKDSKEYGKFLRIYGSRKERQNNK